MAGRHGSVYWLTCFWFVVLVCAVAVAVLKPAAAVQPAWPAETTESFSPVVDEPMMVVSLDGGLHAVNPVTKKKLWSFESGPQLATTFKARRDKEGRDINASMDDLGGDGEEWSIFPGPDGNLFIQDEGGIKPLPVSIKQLVESSPHHTDDGAVILSTVTNTAFLLNKDTGALIRKFENNGRELEKAASLATGNGKSEDADALLESTSDQNSDPGKIIPRLLCLRTDYTVTVQEIATGRVKWNVSLGEVKTFPLLEPGCSGQSSIADDSTRKSLVASYPPGTKIKAPRPSYEAAQIGIFSSAGEYISNLVPETPSGTGRMRISAGDPIEKVVTGKPSDMHRNHPSLDNSGNKQLVPVLSQVGEELRSPFVTIDDLKNRSGDHKRAPYKRLSNSARLQSFIGLLGIGILSLGWFVYSHLWFKRVDDEVAKLKKAGTNRGRKKSRKGTANKGSAGVNGFATNGTMQPEKEEDPMEVQGKRRITMETSAYGEGMMVGRLFVTKVVIGAGSNGTRVFEGYLDGRNVAVKKILASFYDKAQKEINFLITSDEHPNVVRYFAMEEDAEFVYVALERCSMSLHDLIVSESSKSNLHKPSRDEDLKDKKHLILPNGKELNLWDTNGRCSSQLLQLMRDIVAGLSHLHAVNIVHRDLKPHNVLVSNGRKLQAKLADMGLSKHLDKDASSYQDTGKGGSGSRGWQAPEQLMEGRQTRAVDIFSLGCVLFFCITGGHHPFGEHYKRDANIANDHLDLFYIVDMPDAHHLIEALLSHDANRRPAAKEVLCHPFFWNANQRLSFLRDASDRVELEDRDQDSLVLPAIEAIGPTAFGASWDTNLDSDLLEDLRRYRRYNFTSVRDLLRIIRNKYNHFRELPQNLQEILGPIPEGYENYFASRFPHLLIEVYKVLYLHCKEEHMFRSYFSSIEI